MSAPYLPAAVRATALGVGARAWLDELPDRLDRLAAQWDFTIGRAYEDATEAYVAPVTLGDGTAAVLKLLVPRGGDRVTEEVTALRLAGGDPCVRLLRASADAMLLERLGPAMAGAGLPFPERLAILTGLAQRVWRPAAGSGLPTGADRARRLLAVIPARWEQLGRPCSARTVAHALACAERRMTAHRADRAVLNHGDVHQWNALRTADGRGWRLVDPDGLLAEPECDLGVLMREDPDELPAGDPQERARWLAARTGRDATAIWEWGVAGRVATGLTLTAIGLQPVASRMLAAADGISAAYPS
ncbi:aminoglycoside phosphotransferase family protein [Actinoplanes sp. N902-109]|uniref:aminoglycoside phosphotransferase family protein n=1 Tax=Actinoplanes sp. (strain N902-109) TaxID=649831 RepID=UPI0005A27FDE|nr:aminoglycoside phosphotransferase family protein [Actinoplanes sp. N902-109]